MRTALYARVSTRDKNQNPEVQLAPMREYCRSMGWEIYREYVDLAPATDLLHRLEWSRMIKDASIHIRYFTGLENGPRFSSGIERPEYPGDPG